MAESATSVGSFAFFGLFAMVSLSPRYLYASGAVAIVPASRKAGNMPINGRKLRTPRTCPHHPENILLAERYE